MWPSTINTNAVAGAWVALGISWHSAASAAPEWRTTRKSSKPPPDRSSLAGWTERSANAFVKQFPAGRRSAGHRQRGGTGISGSANAVSNLALASNGTKVALAWTQSVNGKQQIYVRENSGGTWNQLNGLASNGGISNSSGHATAAVCI